MMLLPLLLLAAFANAATGTETVDLKGAGNYAILAETGITNVPDSIIIGDIAVSPITFASMTGWALAKDGEGMHALSSQVQGKVFAADYGAPTPAVLTEAVTEMHAAYTDAMGRTTDASRTNVLGGAIGGLTLTPGVYSFTTAINIYSEVIFEGGPDDVFIIKTTGVLTLYAGKKVTLKGGAQAKNVFWVVAGNAVVQPNASMQGIILCKTGVAMQAGSSLNGRILAQTLVALIKVSITAAVTDSFAGEVAAGVNFGGACEYAILAKSGISTVPSSYVSGDIGVSPITAAAMTGFALTLGSDGQHSTSTQVSGQAHGASYGGDIANTLRLAVLGMEAAYTEAAGRTNFDARRINVGNGNIGGLTLTPGVYTFTVGIRVTSDVTFKGGPDDIFILQTTGVLSSAAGIKVILSGGASARNIIWQVAGNAAIGADAEFQGILLVKTDVVFVTGSSLIGTIMAQTAVALQKATILSPPGGICGAPTEIESDDDVVVDGPAAPVEIGTANFYAILASCISTAGTSTITGNIGTSGNATSITGFDLALDSTLEFSTASEFSMKAFASDYAGPVPDEVRSAIMEMKSAFADASKRSNNDDARINLGDGAIGGKTLTPGVYTFTVFNANAGILIDSDIILEGGPDDVFIIQTNGDLTQTTNTEVILSGGVKPKNVFWQVAGDVTVGADAEFQGVILTESDVLFKAGSTLEGRILTQGCVDIETMVIIGTEEAFCG
jgi:hypothetical protein